MPGIDRATRPEIVARFRREFDLVQGRLGKEFGLSLATVQRYENRGVSMAAENGFSRKVRESR